MTRLEVAIVACVLILSLAIVVAPKVSAGQSVVNDELRSTAMLVFSGFAFCAGVFLSPTQVLTAAHCLQNGIANLYVQSYLGWTAYAVERQQWHPEVDLAVLGLDRPLNHVRPVRLQWEVRLGEGITTIGAPRGNRFTMSWGRISKIERLSFDDGWGWVKHQTVLTDAPAYLGSSGGPVFNDEGELIGIVIRTMENLWALAVGPKTIGAYIQ